MPVTGSRNSWGIVDPARLAQPPTLCHRLMARVQVVDLGPVRAPEWGSPKKPWSRLLGKHGPDGLFGTQSQRAALKQWTERAVRQHLSFRCARRKSHFASRSRTKERQLTTTELGNARKA